MKAYLIITGTIFGLMAALHVWRAIAEWNHFTSDPGFMFGMTAIVIFCSALSVWAWRLLLRRPRP